MVNIEKRLEELGIELPETPRPIAAYIPALLSTKYLFVSYQPRHGRAVEHLARLQRFTGAKGYRLDTILLRR